MLLHRPRQRHRAAGAGRRAVAACLPRRSRITQFDCEPAVERLSVEECLHSGRIGQEERRGNLAAGAIDVDGVEQDRLHGAVD